MAAGSVPVTVDDDKASVNPVPVPPAVSVPVEVSEDVTTLDASVDPVRVPAGAAFSVANAWKGEPFVLVQMMPEAP